MVIARRIFFSLELNLDESELDVTLSTRKVFKVSAYKMNLHYFCVLIFSC